MPLILSLSVSHPILSLLNITTLPALCQLMTYPYALSLEGLQRTKGYQII